MYTIILAGKAYIIYKLITKLLYCQKQSFADVLQIGALKNFANFTGKLLCWSLFLIKLQLQLYQKETPTQVFFCEIREKFKKTFF